VTQQDFTALYITHTGTLENKRIACYVMKAQYIFKKNQFNYYRLKVIIVLSLSKTMKAKIRKLVP